MWRRFSTQLRTLYPPPSSAFKPNHIAAASTTTHPSTASGNVDSGKRRALGHNIGTREGFPVDSKKNGVASVSSCYMDPRSSFSKLSTMGPMFPRRFIATIGTPLDTVSQDASTSDSLVAPRIKFKRLDKTAKHIMQILDKEAVEEVRTQKEIPDIRPGYILQLKVEIPENKRRVSIIKGIVIARRNAGLNTTFRLRRLVAGVGIESLFHLYSPNIKEVKVVDKKKVRRAKLYYLRDRMNALKKQ
ncbi:50S ribosomal protein L19-1, chloroplastic-like [Ipomoea triloba]|uniref:50S ribosomal protein L19-1, chloroplastic-like n=1 Tax=Ipomoea triloba TaxID=35885 RepID=UPI00125E6684|nr:50S ribosomal protein L19-1, chloroplastic-like [Ipomoea triloba]